MVIALTVACALFMQSLDGTIITTALPAMAESFGEAPARLSIGITAYMIALAIFIPISGWFADKYGARTVFRAAIAVFTISSILCGLCNSLIELCVARVIQGIGGALMVPVGRLVLLRAVDKSELVRAMGWVTMPALLGPVLGPPIGGFITTYVSWRWIFLLNVPFGILGVILVTRLIENYKEAKVPRLDWFGFVTSGAALAGLVYGIDLIGHPSSDGDTLVIIAILAVSLGLGLIMVRHSLRRQHPLIDFKLIKLRTFAATTVGGAFFRIGAGTVPFLLPLLFQLGFGATAFVSGLLTCASALGTVVMKGAAQPILLRFGFRRVLAFNAILSGVIIMSFGFLFTPETSYLLIFVVVLLGGFSRSLEFTSLNTIAYADVPPNKMSASTSIVSMVLELTNGFGVAIGALMIQVARNWSGELTVMDFRVALVLSGIISLMGLPWFLRLDPAAGSEVSGHRHRKQKKIPDPAPLPEA